jgi:hypothetical protein
VNRKSDTIQGAVKKFAPAGRDNDLSSRQKNPNIF